MISVIILTKNEEQDLPRCLNSLHWCNDVHVLDSGSTDKTVEIAEEFGAKVSFNKFKSFGDQRNHALNTLPTTYQWILFLDADEVMTEKFQNAIFQAVKNATDETAGFYCCWKMMLEDRWLKYC